MHPNMLRLWAQKQKYVFHLTAKRSNSINLFALLKHFAIAEAFWAVTNDCYQPIIETKTGQLVLGSSTT